MSSGQKSPGHTFAHYLLTVVEYLLKGLVWSVMWLFIGFIGFYIFQKKKTPYDIIVGLPLLLVAFGFISNNFQSVFLSIFSPRFNRGICRWCK